MSIDKEKQIQSKHKKADATVPVAPKLGSLGATGTSEVEKKGENLLLLKDFKPLNAFQKQRDFVRGGLSVVNAATGKRVTLSKAILELLPLDIDSIQIGYSHDCLLISNYIDQAHMNYNMKSYGNNSKTIYSSSLVHSIVIKYELDYSDCTSLSFPIKKVIKEENRVLIVIDITSNNTNRGD